MTAIMDISILRGLHAWKTHLGFQRPNYAPRAKLAAYREVRATVSVYMTVDSVPPQLHSFIARTWPPKCLTRNYK
jgi:hypothetical protein